MFNQVYQNKKVLITGNTGFKGSWLCTWLLQLGAEVYGISKDIPTNPSMFAALNLENKITHYQEDIRNNEAIISLIANIQPDFVFHLAAQPIVRASYFEPVETMSTNVLGTTHILEALRLSNHQCTAIFITSDKCYDNVEWTWGYRENDALGGQDPYSASKGAAELVIKTYYHSFFNKANSNVEVVSTRAGNVIGGGDWADSRLVPDCMRAWSNFELVEIRSPQATRPWQHVLEPLSGYLRVGEELYHRKELNGESFNFGPTADQNKTVLELMVELTKYWDFPEGFEQYRIHENSNFHEAGLLKLNCDKALHYLNWQPALAFEQTTKFTAEWYDAFYNKKEVDIFELTNLQIQAYSTYSSKIGNKWINQLV